MGATKKFRFSEEENELAGYARAIAHPARVAILRYLSGRRSCVCGNIVTEIGLSQSTVSQHLFVLKEAGLVIGNEEGASVCYCIDRKKWRKVRERLQSMFRDAETCDC